MSGKSESKEAITPIEEDTFASLIGHFGRWQLLIFGSIFLIKIPSGWIQMAIVFLTSSPVFWCVEFASNHTGLVENSTCYRDCIEYKYDTSPMENTIMSQWALICDRAWLGSFTQTMLQFGILFGSVVFGFLADRYGRKPTFLVAVMTMTSVGLGVPFAPSYLIFTTLRFILGFATAGTMVVSFVMVMEIIGPRYRELIGSIYQIPFVLGHLIVPLVAFYFRSWDSYLLVLGACNLIYLMYFFVLTESPRWLVSVGRIDKASDILNKAAKMNKLPAENVFDILTKQSKEAQSNCKEQTRLNYSALFRVELRGRTALAFVAWLITGHTFYGFNQYIGQTSPNPFLSVALAAIVQLPAILLSIWMMRQFGRKISCVSAFIVCGTCIVTLSVIPQTFWLTLTIGSIGNCFASACATCIYVYTSELFPTVVRNMGFGLCSMAMRLGSMVAPFSASAGSTAYWLPTLVFGATPIATGLLIFLLPETKGRKLPDSIEDLRTEG